MTLDPALLHHPTDSLILPSKRRFFPLQIPNFHQQLRNYISTSDPDRIYVVAKRVVYAIHISSQKREGIAIIPFEPRCLAAGHGWICIGGADNGECALIRIADRSARMQGITRASQPSDVDSALPIDLDAPTRVSSPWTSNEASGSARRGPRQQLPEVQFHKFGGSIVNSVTIHRLPGDNKGLADEDVVILSNNDKTVTVYSLTRTKVLEVIKHPACMNYAIISPDSSLLAAVGDENRAYFYTVTRDLRSTVTTENGEKFTGWDWKLIRCIEMDISTRFEDGCCFTIAFSPSSHLCAIGSQSGVITVFDVRAIRESSSEPQDRDPEICHFRSSKPYPDGGAVRCMMFSSEPWDLLVWMEDRGRAGIADVRQAFTRRQILDLDTNAPGLQEVCTELILDDPDEGLELDFDDRNNPESRHEMDAAHRTMLDTLEASNEQGAETSERQSLRETLLQDLAEGERLIVGYMNTARRSSILEEGLTERATRLNVHPLPAARSRPHGSTDTTSRIPRPTSPLHHDTLREFLRGSYSRRRDTTDRDMNARRQGPSVLSQIAPGSNNHDSDTSDSDFEVQPSATFSWTGLPPELQPTVSDTPRPAHLHTGALSNLANDIATGNRSHGTAVRPRAFLDVSVPAPETLTRQRSQRSSSTPRRSERQEAESRHDPPRLLNSELRANVTAERLRRQRQTANEVPSRTGPWAQRHRPQAMGFEQARSPRWARSSLDELPDRGSDNPYRDHNPRGTSGLGWGADGRTLYVGTVEGIFEFQLNIHDRKTFPDFSLR